MEDVYSRPHVEHVPSAIKSNQWSDTNARTLFLPRRLVGSCAINVKPDDGQF